MTDLPVDILPIVRIAAPIIIVLAVIAIVRGAIYSIIGGPLSELFAMLHRLPFSYDGLQEGIVDYDTPKSVSGGDSLFLPRILRDFPDFSISTAKAAVRERIEEEMKGVSGLRLHRIAISDYIRSGVEKEIVFQCTFEYMGSEHKEQKRYCLHYVFAPGGDALYTGMLCPNCGAPIPATSSSVCEYCGCGLVNNTGASWSFTQVYEK